MARWLLRILEGRVLFEAASLICGEEEKRVAGGGSGGKGHGATHCRVMPRDICSP